MTTETQRVPATGGTTLLLRSGLAALVVATVVVVVAAVAAGGPGALGAAAGGAVALLVFLGGGLVVDTVAGIAPRLSLLFALSTYLLQVLALGLFFAVLQTSGLLGPTLDPTWIGAAIIAVTAVWLVAQVLLTTRARIPVYDLGPQAGRR